MELFTIERYVGDSDESSVSTESKNGKESQNLTLLLEQARGRKRKQKCSSYGEENEIDENKIGSRQVLESSPKAKKRKKENKQGREREVTVATEERKELQGVKHENKDGVKMPESG